VDTLATFREMLEHLASAAEVAIDLEHHDYRTYRGISCLMQISSRERDFIVDILDPVVRDNAQELNVVFTDPSIVKVREQCCKSQPRYIAIRSFTVPSLTSSGYNEILVCISSIFSTPIMLVACSVSYTLTHRRALADPPTQSCPRPLWPSFLNVTSASRPTSDISSQTGEQGALV
jgi:hypothetical protein